MIDLEIIDNVTSIDKAYMEKYTDKILKEIEKANKKNIITANAERQEVKTSSSWGSAVINLSGDTRIGNKIIREGSKIKIADNISKVKISATCNFLNSENSGDKNFSIYKNGNNVFNTYTSGRPLGGGNYENHSLSPIIMNVKQNDYFELRLVSGSPTTMTILNSALTIEEII